MKKVIKITTLCFALIIGLVFFLSKIPATQDIALKKLTAAAVDNNNTPVSDRDNLTIFFCGTGGPFPDIDRAGPCTLIQAGNKLYLIDSGTGGAQVLRQKGLNLGELDAVLFTHLHSDHIAGFGDIAMNSWAAGRKKPLQIFGPVGIKKLAKGTFDAYSVDSESRINHHGIEIFPAAAQNIEGTNIDLRDRQKLLLVLEDGDLKISAFKVNHEPLENAFGYLVQYKDRSVIFSGDTVKDENMVKFGMNVDVMVHEAMGMENMSILIDALSSSGQDSTAKILRDASMVHTSPIEAAEIANSAKAALLVLNHVVPPLPLSIFEDRFLKGVSSIRPKGVLLSYDGLTIRLPVKSKEITLGSYQ